MGLNGPISSQPSPPCMRRPFPDGSRHACSTVDKDLGIGRNYTAANTFLRLGALAENQVNRKISTPAAKTKQRTAKQTTNSFMPTTNKSTSVSCQSIDDGLIRYNSTVKYTTRIHIQKILPHLATARETARENSKHTNWHKDK